jgi:hypothetical protein
MREPRPLETFLPEVPTERRGEPVVVRSAVASTFVAALELCPGTVVGLRSGGGFRDNHGRAGHGERVNPSVNGRVGCQDDGRSQPDAWDPIRRSWLCDQLSRQPPATRHAPSGATRRQAYRSLTHRKDTGGQPDRVHATCRRTPSSGQWAVLTIVRTISTDSAKLANNSIGATASPSVQRMPESMQGRGELTVVG